MQRVYLVAEEQLMFPPLPGGRCSLSVAFYDTQRIRGLHGYNMNRKTKE